MSGGQRSFLTWVVIILIVSYLLGINVAAFVTSVLHAAQTVHNTNAH